MKIFEQEDVQLLVDAFLVLENREQCKGFIEDVMTNKEILDIAQRLRVAKLLREKKVYNDISDETGASTATISRVNKCLVYGDGGYATVLEKLENK